MVVCVLDAGDGVFVAAAFPSAAGIALGFCVDVFVCILMHT